jgi:subtilisin family serine protease
VHSGHPRLIILIALGFLLAAGHAPAEGFASPASAWAATQAAYEALLPACRKPGTVRLIARSTLASLAAPSSIALLAAESIAARWLQNGSSHRGACPTTPSGWVDAAGMEDLVRNPDVLSFQEDGLSAPSLQSTIPLIGADDVWAAGYTGSGQTIAILDTGVDGAHTFLTGKIVGQACFSTTFAGDGATTLCPNGQQEQFGSGAGVNCSIEGCDHGTHVAGIAAGEGATFSGVARDATLLAVQIFSRFDGTTCALFGMPSPCVLTYTSDQIAGLDWVYGQRLSYAIAAANMSIGDSYTSPCNSDRQAQHRQPAVGGHCLVTPPERRLDERHQRPGLHPPQSASARRPT